jgi:hypothetical protein
MPKYQVTALEQVKYLIEVDAESADQAETIARQQWEQSPNPEAEFETQGYGIEITHVYDDNGEPC